MRLRRLALVAFGAWLSLAGATAAHARRAPPSREAMTGAAQDAALALASHDEGNWELAAKHGKAALDVLGPAFGWS